MSKSIKAFVAISLIAIVGACAQQEEEVMHDPVMEEPVQTKL